MGGYRFMGCFESRNRLFPRDGRKGIEEFIEAMATLKIIHRISKGDPGPAKNRRSSKYFRVTVDYGR